MLKDKNKLLRQQLFTFGIIGALAGFIDYAIMVILHEITELEPVTAATFGYIAGAINSYFFNKNITFKRSNNYVLYLCKFATIALFSLFLNVIFMQIMIHRLGIYYMIAKIITMVILLFMNFYAHKFWTFRDT